MKVLNVDPHTLFVVSKLMSFRDYQQNIGKENQQVHSIYFRFDSISFWSIRNPAACLDRWVFHGHLQAANLPSSARKRRAAFSDISRGTPEIFKNSTVVQGQVTTSWPENCLSKVRFTFYMALYSFNLAAGPTLCCKYLRHSAKSSPKRTGTGGSLNHQKLPIQTACIYPKKLLGLSQTYPKNDLDSCHAKQNWW